MRTVFQELSRGEKPWPLTLSGAPGLGKTCAGLLLLDYAGGLYFTACTLADTVLQAAKGQLLTPRERRVIGETMLWHEIGQAALVVLDDLGARERVGDWQYQQVKRLLDDREGMPLVILTNLDLETLDKLYDERITSRLAGGTYLRLEGVDRRLEESAGHAI